MVSGWVGVSQVSGVYMQHMGNLTECAQASDPVPYPTCLDRDGVNNLAPGYSWQKLYDAENQAGYQQYSMDYTSNIRHESG